MKILGILTYGALTAVMLRFVFFDEWSWFGWIEEHLGVPSKSIWFWAFAGAVMAVSVELLSWAWHRDYSTDLRKWADRSQHEYREEAQGVTANDVHRFFRTPTEKKNQIRTEVGGLAIAMVDVTTEHRDSERGRSYQTQTVTLVPTENDRLPEFELRPQSLSSRLGGLLGFRGFKISGDHLGAYDAAFVAKFNRMYRLHSRHQPGTAVQDAKTEVPRVDDELSKALNLASLRVLVEHPGWCIDSQQGQLAIWRPRRLLVASRRDKTLAFVRELTTALLDESQAAYVKRPEIDRQASDPRALGKQALGTALGAMVGFFAGGMIAMAINFSLNTHSLPVMAATFFGPIILLCAAGALLGSQLARRL